MKKDAINPSHYKSHPSGVECIEVTRHMTFNVGNAVKYLWRNGLKEGNPSVQDLKKAVWYIEDEIKRIEKLTFVPPEKIQYMEEVPYVPVPYVPIPITRDPGPTKFIDPRGENPNESNPL